MKFGRTSLAMAEGVRLTNRFHKDIHAIEQSVNSFLEYIEHRQKGVLQRLGCAVLLKINNAFPQEISFGKANSQDRFFTVITNALYETVSNHRFFLLPLLFVRFFYYNSKINETYNKPS
ncbi:hypothetical protein BV455_03575 [Parageobacillus caldoxylosilyticus]|nr:hypothetical protein BV455_03575 [Parageobacillus caldoxylosilyticus]